MSADAVSLSPYDPQWPQLAAKEIAAIRAALAGINFQIEHVGSTAVPGLSAKPVLDILIGVDSMVVAQQFVGPLENLGYSFWRENPNKAHLFFVKGLPITGGAGRTHHVHLYERNSNEFRKMLLFRDFLRTNAATAQEYLELKLDLARRFSDDREAYTKAKTDFVESVVRNAITTTGV